MARSEDFPLRSFMLLLARWPGVWLRGSGWGSSSDSPDSSARLGLSPTEDWLASIFCDRTVLIVWEAAGAVAVAVFCGDLADLSAMASRAGRHGRR